MARKYNQRSLEMARLIISSHSKTIEDLIRVNDSLFKKFIIQLPLNELLKVYNKLEQVYEKESHMIKNDDADFIQSLSIMKRIEIKMLYLLKEIFLRLKDENERDRLDEVSSELLNKVLANFEEEQFESFIKNVGKI